MLLTKIFGHSGFRRAQLAVRTTHCCCTTLLSVVLSVHPVDSNVPLALTARHTSTRGTQHTPQTARGQQPTQQQHSVHPCLWYHGPCSVLILLSLGVTSRRMCRLCEIRRLVGYWLRTCFYSYTFIFSVSAALLVDHRHTHTAGLRRQQ